MVSMVNMKVKQNFILKMVKGRKPLKGRDLKNLKTFIEIYADRIVEKWIDFFVYHKEVEFEKITKKL